MHPLALIGLIIAAVAIIGVVCVIGLIWKLCREYDAADTTFEKDRP